MSLKAAIEFKFAATETEFKKAIGGLNEDRSAYSGSEDWKEFFSVIYQTEAFRSQQAAAEAVNRGRGEFWRVVVVTGSGGR